MRVLGFTLLIISIIAVSSATKNSDALALDISGLIVNKVKLGGVQDIGPTNKNGSTGTGGSGTSVAAPNYLYNNYRSQIDSRFSVSDSGSAEDLASLSPAAGGENLENIMGGMLRISRNVNNNSANKIYKEQSNVDLVK